MDHNAQQQHLAASRQPRRTYKCGTASCTYPAVRNPVLQCATTIIPLLPCRVLPSTLCIYTCFLLTFAKVGNSEYKCGISITLMRRGSDGALQYSTVRYSKPWAGYRHPTTGRDLVLSGANTTHRLCGPCFATSLVQFGPGGAQMELIIRYWGT